MRKSLITNDLRHGGAAARKSLNIKDLWFGRRAARGLGHFYIIWRNSVSNLYYFRAKNFAFYYIIWLYFVSNFFAIKKEGPISQPLPLFHSSLLAPINLMNIRINHTQIQKK